MDRRPSLARHRFPVLVLVLAIGLGVAGCGGLGTIRGRVEQPQLVTERQIHRYPPRSPARTVLRWWRALQFKSTSAALPYYSASSGVTQKELAHRLHLGADLLGLRASVRIVDEITRGERATVFTLLTRVFRHPNGRTDRRRSPQAFDLVREHGQWRIANNVYMDRIWQNVRLFIKEGSDTKPGGK